MASGIKKRRRLARYKKERKDHLRKCAICRGTVVSVNDVINPHCHMLEEIDKREGRPKK